MTPLLGWQSHSKTFRNKKEVNLMVELDQFKFILNGYEGPLVELRDSL